MSMFVMMIVTLLVLLLSSTEAFHKVIKPFGSKRAKLFGSLIVSIDINIQIILYFICIVFLFREILIIELLREQLFQI